VLLFDKEVWRIIGKVVLSWQVLAVAVFFLLYTQLVSYVAKLYHPKRKGLKRFVPKMPKPVKAPKEAAAEEDETGEEEPKNKKGGLGAKLREKLGKKKKSPAPEEEEDDEGPPRQRKK
jgi:hypothetical protein